MSPSKVALTHDGGHTTYGELADRVNRLAAELRRRGVDQGDRVAYLGPNHPAAVETFFAAGLIGAVYLPLNIRLSRPELDYIIADARPSVILEPSGEELPEAEPIDEPVTLDDLCLIMYTSGTTGRPKGAMLTHANLTWNVYNHLIDIDLRSDDVTLVTAPLFHIAALAQSYLPTMIKGGRAVIMPAFDADRVLELIEHERVTSMFGVPAMYTFIAQSARWPAADLSSLRLLECGGAPVPEPLIHTYQERGLTFLQGYGMTEAAPGVLYLPPQESVRKAGTAGVPAFFTDVRLDGGEILVQGPNVFAGYWGVDEPATEDGWFRSGDAAVQDEEGFYRVVDRIKDMIISGGENIYPAEVESALLTHPGIVDCAVVGVPDDRWGEVGKAFVVSTEPVDVLAHLDGRLARYKIPKYVEFVTALPRTASGKILRRELK
ncbi:acyl-CoA synthetase [Nonomuraea soli]|uniref:Fatty-acyl-CoA synthase n=1 Tax=Nonomuraea soli TaxID=1032476 RepID=A0A7W0CHX4_9ACTN|nr:long-chain fatty acid--CoA ligase [Nonomuraea soli]MBA2891436.1 fatty-acyl-CoA synthase [Nonomuraea soli]